MSAEDDGARSLEDLTEAAAGGLRWVAYARIAIEVLLLAAMVLLARIIPPAAFGIFAILIIVQEVALTMPMEGVGGALVQRRNADREHFQAGLLLTIANGLVLAALTVLLAVLVAGPLFGHETEVLMIAMTPLFLMGAVFALPMAVLRRRLDFGRISLLEVVQNATRVVATIALALLGLDAPALVFGGMIGMAVGVVLALWFAPVPLPRWHRRAARDLLPYGGPAALATISWTGFRNGDYAIVGAVLGPAQAGLYWRAYQLAVEYQSKVAVTMTQIAFPVLSRSDDVGEMLALRQRMVRLQAVVIFPLLVVLVLTAPALIPWLFGPDWTAAVTPAQILVLGGAATLVINACGSALMAMGRSRALLGYGVAHFVVYAAAVLATAHLGIVAVAVSGSVVHTVFLAVAYELLLRGTVPSPQRVLVADLAPAVCACAGLVALALPAELALEAAGAPVTALLAGVCLAAAGGYLGTLRLIFPVSARDLGLALARILPDRFSRRRPTPGPAGTSTNPRLSATGRKHRDSGDVVPSKAQNVRETMPPSQNSTQVPRPQGSAIAGRRMFVTGGAGTIGSTLVDQLVEAGAAEVVVLDNFVRGRHRNLEWATANGNLTVVEGDVRDRELVAELCEGIDIVFHQAAIRITQCAEEPRLALEVLVDGTFNVVEAAAAARVRKLVAASSASVYGLATEFPTAEDHHPYANDTLYGACEGLQRGSAAQLPRDAPARLCRPALLQRLRPADGRPRPLHRGPGSLDGADRGRRAAADLRRWGPDDGLRLRSRYRPRQRPRRRGAGHRRRLQRRQRDRDQPPRAGRSAAAGDGLRSLDRVRARARRQLRHPAPRRHHRRRARARFPGRDRPRGGPRQPGRVVAGRTRDPGAGRHVRGLRGGLMEVPFAKPWFGGGESEAVAAVIASGWLTQGPEVQEFERAFAARVGAADAVATTSCTTALQLSLYVSGVGPGDEVIVPSLSFIATANAVWQCGATPVFADIDPATCNLDPANVERALTPRTKAVMPVHQVGLPADMDGFAALAERYGLVIVEDAACAIGAEHRGRPIGSLGNLACFSFHPRKVITCGEGGMIAVDDPALAERLRRLRQHAMDRSALDRHGADEVVVEHYPERGWNARMTDLQAAIGLRQLG